MSSGSEELTRLRGQLNLTENDLKAKILDIKRLNSELVIASHSNVDYRRQLMLAIVPLLLIEEHRQASQTMGIEPDDYDIVKHATAMVDEIITAEQTPAKV
jgi:hypothetical protein